VTAVLAAAARAALYVVLGLAALADMLWAALSHSGFATMARLAVMFVTVAGCGVALEWLGKRRRGGAAMNDGSGTGRAVPGPVCPGCGSLDVDLRRGLLCGTCAAAVAPAGDGDG
jgi:hypothetical protein